MQIIAFGDVHMDFRFVPAIPGIRDADLVLLTGDLTNYGGRKEAEEVVAGLLNCNKNFLALAGNLDHKTVDTYLSGLGINLHGQGKILGGIGLVGLGGSNPTPFNTPNEYSELELAAALEKGFEEVKDAAAHILVSHTPPHGTIIDRLRNGAQVGSRAVRAFIEAKQPAVCLVGHIHEARGEDHIGVSHIINPGMVRDGYWVEVLCEPGKIRAVMRASGNKG